MSRSRNKLTARAVAALETDGRHSDGGNLYLVIGGKGGSQSRRWVFMFTQGGKRREMGLGAFPVVGLVEARKARDEAEKILRDGGDPIEVRNEARKPPVKIPTFGEAADDLIASRKGDWRNEKHAWQWSHTLRVYAKPLRSKKVDEIGTADILAVLKPLWTAKQETAARLRGRIEMVLDAAKALKQIPEGRENPARWKGNLAHLLTRRKKLQRGHHPALAYKDMPAFMAELRGRDGAGVSGLALEFTILNALRSAEALGARHSEIDYKEKLLIIPAERMKAGVEHRAPLCDRSLAIIAERKAAAPKSDLIFPGRGGKPLSNMAMMMLMRRMERNDITVHGFRSTFRDWAGDETHFPREVCEAALAHVIHGVEGAYRRGDGLAKRRALMAAWAAHCDGQAAGENVIPIKVVR